MNKHTRWNLQDAKARFSEVVRLASEEGPQHVSVHGKEKAVVISAEEYERLAAAGKPRLTGQALIDAMQDPRIKGLKFGRDSFYSPVRDAPDFNLKDENVSSGYKRRKRVAKAKA